MGVEIMPATELTKAVGKIIQSYENKIGHWDSKALGRELKQLVDSPEFEAKQLAEFYIDKMQEERSQLIRIVGTSILEDIKQLLKTHLKISDDDIKKMSPTKVHAKGQGYFHEVDTEWGFVRALAKEFDVEINSSNKAIISSAVAQHSNF